MESVYGCVEEGCSAAGVFGVREAEGLSHVRAEGYEDLRSL